MGKIVTRPQKAYLAAGPKTPNKVNLIRFQAFLGPKRSNILPEKEKSFESDLFFDDCFLSQHLIQDIDYLLSKYNNGDFRYLT